MRGAWQATIVDDNGNVQPFAGVEVRNQDGALVSLFDAPTGGSAISNPFDADGEGFARFYCDPQLVDITANTASGVRTWDNVLIPGTAATADTGTEPDEVPLNSDLGTAAYKAVGTQAEQLPRNSDLQQIGVGQTWQDVLSSRAEGVTYTNNTGKPIFVSAIAFRDSSQRVTVSLYVNDNLISRIYSQDSGSTPMYVTAQGIIPNGSTYYVTVPLGELSEWKELR